MKMKEVCCPFPDVEIKNIDLWELFLGGCTDYSKKVAVVDSTNNCSFTYSKIHVLVENVAWNLLNIGFNRHTPLLIYMKNCIEYVLVSLAVWRLGGTLVITNPLVTPDELLSELKLVPCDIIICDKFNEASVREVTAKLGVKKIFVRGSQDIATTFSRLMTTRKDKVEKYVVNPRQDVALIAFSSGTTGLPKAVEITHRALVGQVRIWGGSEMDNLPKKCGVIFQPFSHIFGMTLMLIYLVLRVKIVIMESFNLEKFLQLVSHHQSDHLLLVPVIAVMLCKSELSSKYDLRCVHYISSGGAPLGRDVQNQLQQIFGNTVQIRQIYGLTETAGGCMGMPSRKSQMTGIQHVQGSVGYPFPNIKAKVIDIQTGESLGPNESGEVCVKCEFFMKGYLNDIDATAQAIDKKGWLHTGDIGYYNSQGCFFIIDRLKEMIKYKGYQVAPAELEDLLLKHPDIKDAGVIGLPDSTCGELPYAWVVKNTHSTLTEADVHLFIKDKVAPFKKLRGGIEFVDTIPKSPSGKILRREIKQSTLRRNSCKDVKSKL